MTLKKWVIHPFLEGHGDSRYLSGEPRILVSLLAVPDPLQAKRAGPTKGRFGSWPFAEVSGICCDVGWFLHVDAGVGLSLGVLFEGLGASLLGVPSVGLISRGENTRGPDTTLISRASHVAV